MYVVVVVVEGVHVMRKLFMWYTGKQNNKEIQYKNVDGILEQTVVWAV